MKIRCLAFFACFLSILSLFTGCPDRKDGFDPRKPVTVTMWHNYGGQMKESMEVLIEEFNNTVGKQRGIVINVTSIAASKEQNEKLTAIANGDPGAPDMPDIVTVYPSIAGTLLEAGLIIPLDKYYTSQELSAYLPQFVEEGRLPDSKLYVFPIAKSTEVLFVNKTLFDRFSAGTGSSLENLATFEGIASAAMDYHAWTDSLTPDIKGDGKAFYTADSWFNIAEVGMAQLGDGIIGVDVLNTRHDAYKTIWNFTVLPAIGGGFFVTNGYSSDLSRTGDIICSTGSTAGALFYGNTITYPDNTIEEVEYIVLPYPVFDGGRKVALQRGAGMVVSKSVPLKEHAAVVFLKWFTEPSQNIRFVTSSGYLPVTKEAFEERMTAAIQRAENPAVGRLLETATKMAGEYDFIVAPNTGNFSSLSGEYEKTIKSAMRNGLVQVRQGGDAKIVSQQLFEEFIH